jgi:HPt (histidine-containing phosphotransfer) domain-containing protein
MAVCSRFGRYVQQQKELMLSALEADAWAPSREAADVAQKTVRAIAHSVKGAAAMVKAQRLTEVCTHLQFACEPMVSPSCSAQDRIDAKALSEVWKREATGGHGWRH